ncbi:ribonuclease P protein component [Nocardia sp. CDC159]|uniref:Ribonuclease P protein component n=1 Tax=Nocardia pulmonis TaxID=2951408 RepID=A0A9X2ED40_9NOCA|nr:MULTISPECIES: ribonuclease P protein component [Nocardia]MCM6776973.1 ribonuclease P protein component [Nocardia pulmonis]MCM6789397.1 ribonuclease P protein component [Nocardia sp. CDC159]
MLPEPYRLHHRADFSRTVRRGRRVGRRDLVVHVLVATETDGDGPVPAVRIGGPRFGLIVSKAVGSAVIRHRVARRLRHMCGPLIGELPEEADVVIRALPGAAHASSPELERQLRGALRKLVPNVTVPEMDPSGSLESGGTS